MADAKKRRISGAAFWRIRASLDVIEKLAKELREWREEQAKALEVYPYQINWGLHVIYAEDCEVRLENRREIVTNGKIEKKVPEEVVAADLERRKKLEDADASLGEFRDKLARRLEVNPFDIDLKTGVVAPAEEYDEIEVDLDKLDEPPPAKPKSKAKKGELD